MDAIQRAIEGDPSVEVISAEDHAEGIRIDVSDMHEPEVNPIVYKDVEGMIFRGFLTVAAEINGVPIIFKSLNHHEFEHINWLNGLSTTTEAIQRFYNTFLAYGIFMFDGQNILSERGKWVPKFQELFAQYPPAVKSKIIRHLSEVNRRASNAVVLTEAFAFESASRFRWAQLSGMDLMLPSCTGVQGTELLGLNYAQLVWRAMNRNEDLREVAEREWDYAKFVGSCFAGKEIKKLFDQDKNRRKKEREERIERRDKLIRQVVLLEKSEEEAGRKGPVKIMARTAEELAAQLEKDLRGEKDWHDRVVDSEQQRIQAQVEARKQKITEMAQMRDEEMNHQALVAKTDLTGLTPQEVQERLTRRRQLEHQRAAKAMVNPEMDQRMEDFLERHGGTYDPTKVTLPQTDRDPDHAMPVSPTPRTHRTPPFRRGG